MSPSPYSPLPDLKNRWLVAASFADAMAYNLFVKAAAVIGLGGVMREVILRLLIWGFLDLFRQKTEDFYRRVRDFGFLTAQ